MILVAVQENRELLLLLPMKINIYKKYERIIVKSKKRVIRDIAKIERERKVKIKDGRDRA